MTTRHWADSHVHLFSLEEGADVALDRARLRTIVTAAHSDEQLDRALVAFARVGRELGVIAG